MRAPVRSWLYVPGHRRDLAEKALAGEADAVVLDLEDAVPLGRKDEARATVADVLAAGPAKPTWVRLNAIGTGLTYDDVAALASSPPAGVRLPKAESSEQLEALAARLPAPIELHLLIESALGLERAFELAAHPAVSGIALGEADLAADLGVSSDEALVYARSRCVTAARAARLAPPVQSVHTAVGDDDALRLTSERARALGFFGRSAIHPRQVPVIHAAYTPSADELEDARELMEALAGAEARGEAALVLPDGRFVDPAVVERARRILAVGS